MDVAYDHVQEEALAPSSEEHAQPSSTSDSANDLNADLQDAFRAVSASPWGSKLGGWFSQARKQGESFVADLQKEAGDVGSQAEKGWSTLREQVVQRTRGMSLGETGPEVRVPGEEAVPGVSLPEQEGGDGDEQARDDAAAEKPESLPADIVKEAGTLVASFRTTAAAKLKDLQKAEDAADEALLKFGTNVRNFLRDAVIITAPTDGDSAKPRGTDAAGNEVLFETSEPGTGRKVFHTTRLDAQLHAIHTTASSFTEDPSGPQWDNWKAELDIDKKTEAIAHDLEHHEELRRAMEKLVPEKVEYSTFWQRYYFLRKAIEEEERRRKEVLKGAATAPAADEEIAWDDDEDDTSTALKSKMPVKPSNDSTTTLHASSTADSELLKPKEPRRSHDEKSVADSDASYDLVSGATTRGPGSPKEERRDAGKETESDDDWE